MVSRRIGHHGGAPLEDDRDVFTGLGMDLAVTGDAMRSGEKQQMVGRHPRHLRGRLLRLGMNRQAAELAGRNAKPQQRKNYLASHFHPHVLIPSTLSRGARYG